jgi:hypothetical protein
MEEMITEYLEENYYVVFASHQSYYCMDKTTKTKTGLNNLVRETNLVFGDIKEITNLTYLWVASKTKVLKEKFQVLEQAYFNNHMTLAEINELIIAEQCTQKCT